MELADRIGMLEHNFRYEGTALQVSPALELEEVALGTQDDVLVETLEERRHRAHRALP
jgi:hypothetical protein